MLPSKLTDPQKPSVSGDIDSARRRKDLGKCVHYKLREYLDEMLEKGDGKTFYGSVLKCKNRETRICSPCSCMARFFKCHARTSKHFYCTVPRCGEVKVHKVTHRMELTRLRKQLRLMTIKGEPAREDGMMS